LESRGQKKQLLGKMVFKQLQSIYNLQ